MTLPSDFPLPTTEPIPPIASQEFGDFLAIPGADLVFTQDGAGQYLSFFWREAERYGLTPTAVIHRSMEETFAPVAVVPYLKRVRQVLDYLIPVRFEYPFRYSEQYLVFDLTISPILMPHGTATTAVVMGQFLYSANREKALEVVNTLVAFQRVAALRSLPQAPNSGSLEHPPQSGSRNDLAANCRWAGRSLRGQPLFDLCL